jgi:hypothetical protein
MTTEMSNYTVVIEWDGDKPPTKWYGRLHKFGLYVRGDKEVSPLERRAHNGMRGSGVVFQEGAITVDSLSTAKTLAFLARDLGAKAVTLNRCEVLSLEASPEDVAAFQRVQAVLSRKGRPPAAQNWVITCIEEAKSVETEESSPYKCPNCQSTNIRYRLGEVKRVRPIAGTDDLYAIFDYWVDCRFQNDLWEESYIDPEAPAPTGKASLDEYQNSDEIHSLLKSKLFSQVEGALKGKLIHIKDAFRFLDAAFFSMLSTQDERQERRLKALQDYIMGGGKEQYSLVANENEVDALDIAYKETKALHILP